MDMRIYLKDIRKRKGLTLMQLEALTGVSNSQLSDIENEKVSPTLYTLCKIATGLKVPISWLFSCDDEEY